MTKLVGDLFDRMDRWRHLPNYQLERRADLLFSMYLPQALETKLGIKIHPLMVPEFPVRIGTIYPHIATDKSVKIDYVCFSADLARVIFVELRTESRSLFEWADIQAGILKKVRHVVQAMPRF
jgi:hypothetical protein